MAAAWIVSLFSFVCICLTASLSGVSGNGRNAAGRSVPSAESFVSSAMKAKGALSRLSCSPLAVPEPEGDAVLSLAGLSGTIAVKSIGNRLAAVSDPYSAADAGDVAALLREREEAFELFVRQNGTWVRRAGVSLTDTGTVMAFAEENGLAGSFVVVLPLGSCLPEKTGETLRLTDTVTVSLDTCSLTDGTDTFTGDGSNVYRNGERMESPLFTDAIRVAGAYVYAGPYSVILNDTKVTVNGVSYACRSHGF